MSVLGFNGFGSAANLSPKLTAVARPTHETGRQAARMLLRKMRPGERATGEVRDGSVVLDAELRLRECAATPPPASKPEPSSQGST